MKKPAYQVVAEKREWNHQPSPEELGQGFKGWYSRDYLPHFDAPGIRQFITYRLADSIPVERLQKWKRAAQLVDEREKFRRMEAMLDRALGSCALQRHDIARMVQQNFWFHDGKDYRLLAWVIMPNHVHVLVETWKPLGIILRNWKSFTSSQGNKLLGNVSGKFWQTDYFDRYIRDQTHYRKVVQYIENNPVNAKLVRQPTQWRWSSARYRGLYGSDESPMIHREECVNSKNRNLTQIADKAVRAPIRRPL